MEDQGHWWAKRPRVSSRRRNTALVKAFHMSCMPVEPKTPLIPRGPMYMIQDIQNGTLDKCTVLSCANESRPSLCITKSTKGCARVQRVSSLFLPV
jgi:hypothetical protein